MLTRSAETFRRRAQITAGIRRYPEHLGFIEIETPVLQAEAGGAPSLHHISQYLRNGVVPAVATELHLKRLIVGGFESI